MGLVFAHHPPVSKQRTDAIACGLIYILITLHVPGFESVVVLLSSFLKTIFATLAGIDSTLET